MARRSNAGRRAASVRLDWPLRRASPSRGALANRARVRAGVFPTIGSRSLAWSSRRFPGCAIVPSSLEISVVVSTYQRPRHLRRCLLSLAAQRGVAGRFEVIVVDDGSQDETAALVSQLARECPWPLKFSTHPHNGFQLARCRNSGIRAALAPYLLFTDGDCIFPPDHLRRHLDARRPGVVRAGECVRLDEATSKQIDEASVRSGGFLDLAAPSARRSVPWMRGKALAYQMIRHRANPKLSGCNIAVWREQLERVNGFDERFRGWGCEDDDLATRLRAAGARIATALGYTHGYHLWHPPDATAPRKWHEGPNVGYFRRPLVLTRCLEGIRRRSIAQVSVRVVGSDRRPEFSRALANLFRESTKGLELEMLVWPGRSHFTADGACRVLIAGAGEQVPVAVERSAHATIRHDFRHGPQALYGELQRVLYGEHPVEAAPAHRRMAA